MAKKTTNHVGSNLKKDYLPKIIELNKKDPSLSYSEIISKLGIEISPSTLSRWVRELKAKKQWTSPSDQQTNEMETLAKKVREAGKVSKLGLSKLLGVSRHKVDKVIAYIANTGDASAKGSDTISTTDNNVISISPLNNKEINEGVTYKTKTRSGEDKKVVILKILKHEIKQKSRIWYVDVTDTKTRGIDGIVKAPLQTCSYSTMRRGISDLGGVSSSQELLFISAKLEKETNFLNLKVGKSYLDCVAGSKSVDELLEGFGDLLRKGNTENRKDDEIYDEESDKYETTFEDQEAVKVKEISRVESLVDIMAQCPHRAVLTESSVTIYDGLTANTVNKEETDKFNKCLDAIEKREWDTLKDICFSRNKVASENKVNFEKFGFTVKGGYVSFGEKEGLGRMMVNGIDSLLQRAKHYLENGDELGVEKIGLFISNLTMNPDSVVISRIIDFIKFKDIQITDEGELIVYKMVRHNYSDCHSGKVDNSVGSKVFMRRALVDNNEKNQCSNGLHVCALNYFGSFNSQNYRLVSCLLDPRDIVSIPADYNGSKIRCCAYTVLEDVTGSFLSGKIKADTVGEFKTK